MLTSDQTIRAECDFKFYHRFLLMAAVALGICIWSIYDGLVKYPNQQIRAQEYERLQEEGKSDDWIEYAKSKGWPTALPGKAKTDWDIFGQFLMAGITGLAAVGLVVYVMMSRGTWIEATSEGLRSSSGQEVLYDQIVSLDKRKWKKKGLAYVTYEQNGRKRRFVIDDFKFLREPTGLILDEVETRLLQAPDTTVST